MAINPPPFERLPLDILHHVLLAIGSISDLSALIRASPVIYRYYLQRPTFRLYHCLKCEFRLGIVDACSVHLSNAADFRPSRTKENVLQFLETYDVQRREHYKTKSILLDKNQIIPAITFHAKILSTTETSRILRAFYRYQLFYNLFGVDVQSKHGIGTGEEKLEEYLDKFQPCEIEEILCVNAFIEDKYSQVLDEVTWDFHPDNPKWDAERTDPSIPEGAYNIEWLDNVYRVGMSSLGFTALSSIFEARDHSLSF
ncbi:hypothetical protein LZL87_010704 [Fusarium oxysporum]|nr:hypothetical protein LZL87_010704 [Fusarium oxysporum]